MPKGPRIYTERVSVRLLESERSAIEDRLGDVAVGAAMRDAALRAIGRDDLVLDTARDETGWRTPREQVTRGPKDYINVLPRLTFEQLVAIDNAARERNVALSALMLDALMTEQGLPLRAPQKQWYPRGKRRSRPPGELKAVKPEQTKKKAARKSSARTKKRGHK